MQHVTVNHFASYPPTFPTNHIQPSSHLHGKFTQRHYHLPIYQLTTLSLYHSPNLPTYQLTNLPVPWRFIATTCYLWYISRDYPDPSTSRRKSSTSLCSPGIARSRLCKTKIVPKRGFRRGSGDPLRAQTDGKLPPNCTSYAELHGAFRRVSQREKLGLLSVSLCPNRMAELLHTIGLFQERYELEHLTFNLWFGLRGRTG